MITRFCTLPVVDATLKLSLLDRACIPEGGSAAQALRGTVALAAQAERLGYHRFWVAEHHSVPGIAGSAPTVLAAAVASATSRIRVGTGGVMLPNHRPLVVAEQFAVLGALFPGRIDLGLGRSVGFTRGIQQALGHPLRDAEDFPDQLAELLEWLGGGTDRYPGVRAQPADGLPVPPFVLALGEGGQVAAEAGLPVVVGGLQNRSRMITVIDEYRAAFRPSQWRERPYVIVAAPIAVAPTTEQARQILAAEAWALAHARTQGTFPPLPSPQRMAETELTTRQREVFEKAQRGHLYGVEAEVRDQLDQLVAETGADEIMVTTAAFDPEQQIDSLRRLAELAGLTQPEV
ncbi:luciferase family oxidoreductase group 1 [Kitasatospora acidiphila]